MNEEQLNSFPESVRDWDEIKNSDDPQTAWDRLGNMRKKFGTGLYQPGDDAGAEDWGKFSEKAVELSGNRLMPRPDLEDDDQRNALYRSLGKPGDIDGYEFEEIEGANTHSDERQAFLKKMAFDANLTKDQLKLIDSTVRQADMQALNDRNMQNENAMKELKQEWGLATDDRIYAALKVAKTFFPHLGENPALSATELKSFHSIAKQFGGKNTEIADQGNQGNNAITPSEAAEKISEIRNNKDHPYYHKSSHGHIAAQKSMRNLYKIKNNIAVD